jgi:hypothetical protein
MCLTNLSMTAEGGEGGGRWRGQGGENARGGLHTIGHFSQGSHNTMVYVNIRKKRKKVAKRKIFELFDSSDFYTTMPLWLGDFGNENILKILSIFGAPFSGSGSGSFRINKQKMKKSLDFYFFVTAYYFLSLKNAVNVPPKRNKHKTCWAYQILKK